VDDILAVERSNLCAVVLFERARSRNEQANVPPDLTPNLGKGGKQLLVALLGMEPCRDQQELRPVSGILTADARRSVGLGNVHTIEVDPVPDRVDLAAGACSASMRWRAVCSDTAITACAASVQSRSSFTCQRLRMRV